MAKIIVAKGDTVLQEMDLSKERITIGRRLYNDIVINDLAISGEHAVIVTEKGDSFLEDLNSTNGTQINGQPVRKHFLRDGDVVEMAQYRLQYLGDAASRATPSIMNTESIFFPTVLETSVPRIREIKGSTPGKEIHLVKPLTTLGRPGAYVSMIVRQQDGYYLTNIEGSRRLRVNDKEVSGNSYKLADGDMLHFEEIQLQFLST